ncbi:hypothetical protein KNE206_44190 [Kitasatospora sp. NE20-6]|uniref:hypothetical protein n=1 Tax=Kitasatospora sp. NE20-6 TaxID=2859066 RepID=UPI0034DBAEAB
MPGGSDEASVGECPSRRQFFRSIPDSRPSTKARAVACGSARRNRPTIRAMAWSDIARQWAASLLWPAAIA